MTASKVAVVQLKSKEGETVVFYTPRKDGSLLPMGV